jgi:hypothetical protein
MKLYTEEEIRKFFTEKYNDELSIDELIGILTPIELPTDEEIDKEFTAILVTEEIKFDDMIEAAKWMRDKIQGGIK